MIEILYSFLFIGLCVIAWFVGDFIKFSYRQRKLNKRVQKLLDNMDFEDYNSLSQTGTTQAKKHEHIAEMSRQKLIYAPELGRWIKLRQIN